MRADYGESVGRPSRRRRRIVVALAAVLMIVLAGFLLMPYRWMAVNDVTTGATDAYPEIVPHDYPQTPDEVYRAMRESCEAIPRWRIVHDDPAARRIDVEVRIPIFGFIDDLTACVEASGAGSRVIIRSHSRVGRGDLGENARHIRALQREMDCRLR